LKKDTTIQSEDVLILDDSDKDLLDEITDITDLIGSTRTATPAKVENPKPKEELKPETELWVDKHSP
jgi:hypothetical protein